MPARPSVRARSTKAPLFTIGYQAHSIESLIQTLDENGVQILMDVRQNPVSRRNSFSKHQLQHALSEAGIEYRHNPDLGTPVLIRMMYRRRSDLPSVLSAYKEHLSLHPEPLGSLAQLAATHVVCLLCLEHDPLTCHRGVIAQMLWEMKKCRPIHLT